MKPSITILCAGRVHYLPLACGCRLLEDRKLCGRVVQQGEPGGATRYEGWCALCKAEQELERERWGREMYRHAHHPSALQAFKDPFEGFQEQGE